MKRSIAILITALVLVCAQTLSSAADRKDHVCFKTLDADHDGVVTFAEFEAAYGSDEAAFNAADLDSDGKLTHDEYHTMLGHGAS